MPDRIPLRAGVAVGLVAGCTLALQVVLTRLFSAVLFYHFAFLAISLALLGAGAGAILVYVRPAWFARPSTESVIARWCVAFALLVVVVPLVVVRLDFPYLTGGVTAEFAAKVAVASVVAGLPFLAAGVAIALAIARYVASAGRVYAFDLGGAGLGALLVVPALWLLDAPTLAAALGVVAGAAALLIAPPGRPERIAGAAAAALAAAVCVVAGAGSLLYFDPPAQRLFGADVVSDEWTPISRVVGYSSPAVTYDQDFAPVPDVRGRGRPDWRALGTGPQSIGYELVRRGGRAAVIGGGGGRDIYNALGSGQRRVDVIELNRAIRDVVDGRLGRYSGSPYSLPGVSYAIGDGRTKLAERDTRYDQVHIGFTTTLAAGSGNAYALSESNLYTLEAFDEYLDHLAPGGVLNVSRPYRLTGEEALRATVLALEALRRRGIGDPERHVAVVLGAAPEDLYGTVLVRLTPFRPDEVALIRRLGDARDNAPDQRLGVVYAPGGPYEREWRELAAAGSPREFCRGYRVDVCPPSDDRPFFFNSTRLGDVLGGGGTATPLGRTPFVVLLLVLGVLAVLAAAAMVLPLALVAGERRPPLASMAFFAAIGLGFLLLEVVLVQRFVLFLGFPTYALSVVLFALLVFTGAGAALSARRADPRRALVLALAVASELIAASAAGLAPLLRALIDLPFAARVAVAVALLAPLGLTLGAAMPIGLRRLAALHPGGVPWAWGVNGVMSVLGSVLAVAVALAWGFTAATLLALACYLAALAHAARGAWPALSREGG
ncbi:MAG TPA: hypothetical protein VF712_07595 [Thermoleophilaceae bacterium]